MPAKITPRKTTYLACPSVSLARGRGPSECCVDPATHRHIGSPARRAPPPPSGSYKGRYAQRDENMRGSSSEDDDSESKDPAPKIWDKIRRASGLSVTNSRGRNVSSSTTASVAASISLPFSPADGKAAQRRQRAGKRPLLMLQRQRVAAMGSRTSLTDRTNMTVLAEDAGSIVPEHKRRESKGSLKHQELSGRGPGRWGLGWGW